jgi:hypothetical protein
VAAARVEGFRRAIAEGVLPFEQRRAAAVLRQLEQAARG